MRNRLGERQNMLNPIHHNFDNVFDSGDRWNNRMPARLNNLIE